MELCLEPGDQVLVLKKGIRGKQKISDHWENTPYQIMSRMGGLSHVEIMHTRKGLCKNISPASELAFPNWMWRSSKRGKQQKLWVQKAPSQMTASTQQMKSKRVKDLSP